MGALKFKNRWLLANGDGPGEGDPIVMALSEKAYLIVHGDFTSVQIQIRANNRTTWVDAEGGLFESPEARLFKGIPKSFVIRCLITGGTSTTVELLATSFGEILGPGSSGLPLTVDTADFTTDSTLITADQTEI